MEKFSVLMSVYFKENQQNFELSLESNMEKQTLQPDEFVLVCDGDLTPELETVITKYTAMFLTLNSRYIVKRKEDLVKL